MSDFEAFWILDLGIRGAQPVHIKWYCNRIIMIVWKKTTKSTFEMSCEGVKFGSWVFFTVLIDMKCFFISVENTVIM